MNIKAAAVQTNPIWGKIDLNFKNICNMLNNVEADLIVFPELCLSGYFFTNREDLSKCTIDREDEKIDVLSQQAIRTSSTIIIGFAERDGDKIFNASIALLPNGKREVYRKTHLFFKERFVFDEGDTGFFTFKLPNSDAVVGMMICYDWRFPEAARTLALQNADIICCPSNLVTDLWRKVMPARTIENKVHLIAANRWGEEEQRGEKLEFKGNSGIWDCYGNNLGTSPSEGDDVVIAELDITETRNKKFNDINDIFLDRRQKYYFKN